MHNAHTPERATPTATATVRRPWTLSRTLVAFGAAGPVLFLALATLLSTLDPLYDARARPMSELALGPGGWLMTVNFWLFGLAIIAFALGLFRSLVRPSRVGTALLVVAGLGIIASGMFPTDRLGAPETGNGQIHNLLFLLVFLALIVSYIFSALAFRREQGWGDLALCTALMPAAVVALLVLFIGFSTDPGDPLYGYGGLVQRVLIAVAFGWMTVVGKRVVFGRQR